MHTDPEQSWLRAEKAISDTADQAAQLEQGIPLRPNRIEGGREGIRYGFNALIAKYRRCPWIDRGGKPQMLIPELPDEHTDILLHKFYCTCLAERMSDMEIVSRIRLYGVKSGSTAATGVDVLQNYGMDAAGMAHLQKDRAEKRKFLDFNVGSKRTERSAGSTRDGCKRGSTSPRPDFHVTKKARIGTAAMHPNCIPYRNHPKAVISQVKPMSATYPDGVKLRTVTDAGAVREPRTSFKQRRSDPRASDLVQHWLKARTSYRPGDGAGVRLAVNLLTQAKEYARDAAQDGADPIWHWKHSTKGAPGSDSVNSCLPPDRVRCKYSSFADFLTALRVLASSGVEVMTIHDDFAAYYEMFPLGSGDRWYSAQLTSADGSDLGTRCDFGTAHLPDDLNRVNFVMCELIAKRAAGFEDDLNAMRSPWSHEYVDKCRIFSATRRLAGQSGAVFAQFPWFDDNVAGVLAPFAQRFQRLRYDTWAEFQWDVAMDKAAINRWGSTATPEPIVGVEVQLHSQTWWFTQDKVKRLLSNISEIKQESIDHPKNLMKKDGVLTVLGRIASATGPVPRIWRHLGGILSLVTCQHFEHYVQANPEMLFLLDRVVDELTNQYGQPTVSYTLRPGQDGRRVWTCFTDASRAAVQPAHRHWNDNAADNVKFGAGGGWFRLWEADTVFFFTHQWPDDQVAACNIGELEMMTAIIAAHLQADVHAQLFGAEPHYLLEYGDNSGVSDHVNNSMRAHSTGMRFLASVRATAEDRRNRMCSSKHIHREWNCQADKLANLDVDGFIDSMASVVPGACFVRLMVPPDLADLAPLIVWNANVASYDLLHSMSTRLGADERTATAKRLEAAADADNAGGGGDKAHGRD
jgi:hypothetical protein